MNLPADRYAHSDSLHLRYWLEGDGDQNLVLLHGIGGTVEIWRKQFEHLPHAHRVLAIDLPGCGRSEVPDEYPPDPLHLFAAAVRNVMQQAGMKQATLLGSSLGGAVAIEFAARWPEMVRSMVLIGPAGMNGNMAWPLRLMALPGVGEALTQPARTRTAQAIRQCVVDPHVVEEEDIDRAYEMSRLPGVQGAFLKLLRVYAGVRGVDRRELRRLHFCMRRVDAPVLVLWGTDDRILPISAAATALTQFPNAGLIVRKGKGHLIFIEEPEWFDHIVSRFVRSPQAVLDAAVRHADAPTLAPYAADAHDLLPVKLPRRATSRALAAASFGLVALLAIQRAWPRSGEGSGVL